MSIKRTLIIMFLFILVCSIGFPAFAAGSKEQGDEQEAASGESAQKDMLTIRMDLMMGPKVEDSWIEHKLEEKIGEVLNRKVDIEPIMLPGWGEAQTKINLLMSDSSTMPDIGWYWEMAKEFQTWVDGGVIVDVAPFLPESNNIINYCSPDTIFAGYNDGKIYQLPGDVSEPGNLGLNIRKDWLDELGLEIPTTVDELYEVAKAFTFDDPDGNGKDDTYGFGHTNPSNNSWQFMDPVLAAYKIHGGNYNILADGTVKHWSVMPGMKDVLSFYRKAYAEGVLDPATFTRKDIQEMIVSGKVGIVFMHVAKYNTGRDFDLARENGFNYIPIKPVAGPDGFASDTPASQYGWCNVFITNRQKGEAEDLMKALDYMVSVEANKYIFFGEEGKHYSYKNGNFKWLIPQEQRDELGLSQFKGFITRKDDANIINSPEVLEGFKMRNETSMPLRKRTFFTAPSFSTPQTDELEPIITELFDKTFTEIVLGNEDLDEYDEYVEEFYDIGGDIIEKEINNVYHQQKTSYEAFMDYYKSKIEPNK